MDETQAVTAMLSFATAVARRMSRDPEAESLANMTVLLAVRSYDGRIPLERWVAACVKRNIWHMWRKGKRRPKATDPWLLEAVSMDDPPEDSKLSDFEWRIVCEKYVDKWADDVIARRNGLTLYEVRKLLKFAVRRLQE